MLSQYCKECIEYTTSRCQGKEGGVITSTYYGTVTQTRPSFLKFCSKYKFDIKLWKRTANDDVFVEDEIATHVQNKQSAKVVKRKRAVAKQERVEVAINTDFATEVETSEELSSVDFEDLLI